MTRGRLFFLAAALALLAADMTMQLRAGNAGDKDWLLLATRMWLFDGRTLYRDIFESNPPLILWIYAVPVWLAHYGKGLQDFEAMIGMGFLAVALAVTMGVMLIRRHPAFKGNARQQTGFALLLAYVLLFFSMDMYFFDRDSVMFVLTFPYLLRFMPGLSGVTMPRPLRFAVALMAAIGFCIKPQAFVVFLTVQLLRLLRKEGVAALFCLENLIIAVGGVAYVLCVWHFTPEYIRTVMPMAAATYSSFSGRRNAILFLTVALVSAGLTFADFRRRYASPYRADVWYFIGICLAFVAYTFLGNGWGYTYNPLLSTLLFLSGWVLWEYRWLKADALARGGAPRPFIFGERACIANLAVNIAYITLYIGVFFTAAPCGKNTDCTGYTPYTAYMKEHHVRSFGTFSMNLRRWTEFTHITGATWETRFNHLWMLPKLLEDSPAEAQKHQWIRDYVSRAYAEDLQARKPNIIFVDRSDKVFNYTHPVDMVGFFSNTPEFAQAWKQYAYDITLDNCDVAAEKPQENKPKSSVPQEKPRIDCRYDVYRRIP